jgi:type IV secretion system protein VirB4
MLRLAEFQERPASLADLLPWAFLIAPGVVLNKDGSFQRTARYRGPDLDSATPEELMAASARVNNVLKRFGSGWALFFEADRTPAPDYPTSEWRDAAAWLVDEERRAAFEESGARFESRYALTFAYLPPSSAAGRAEDLLLERAEGEAGPSFREHLNVFLRTTDRALDLIAEIMPEAAWLDDEETLTQLHAAISPKRHRVAVPEVPACLDAILPDAPLTGGLSPRLGDAHLRTLTVRGFPNATEPGLLDELNRLGFAYRWVTRFLPLDKTDATKALTRYRRQWFAKRKSIAALLKEVLTNEASVLVDSDADNKTADADAALQELGADDVAFGYVTTTVTVMDEDFAAAEERARAVERVVNGRGFVTIRESVNAVEAWLGSLPGHAYANIRQPIIHTLNLAHMTPLSAVWAGPDRNAHLDGPPLVTAVTDGATPFRLVTHQGDVGHTLVVGPTGAGKSVLLSLLALQFRRYPDAQVFVFDKGGSARCAVAALGGEHYDLGSQDGIGFQPLARIDQETEAAWALAWLLGLVAHEGGEVTPETKEKLWSALQSLSTAPVEERTLTGLTLLLSDNALAQALAPYTLDGPHGRLLDAAEEQLGLSDVQCFEMEELMAARARVAPVLIYLFHRLEARFDGRPSLLVLDEAWVFLDDPLFAERIREWLKVLRKKNVAVVFATQSLADVTESAIAAAVIESCPSRIFLPNDRAVEPQQREAYRRFGLNDRQIEILSRATPKRDYYFQSRRGNRLFDLDLGRVALAFCASASPDDQALIARTLAAHGRDGFAPAFLRARGLGWAADLIDQFESRTPAPAGEMENVPCAAE